MHQMLAELECHKVAPPQGPGGEQGDDQPVAVPHRPASGRQLRALGFGFCHQPQSKRQQVVAALQAGALAMAPLRRLGLHRGPQPAQRPVDRVPVGPGCCGGQEQAKGFDAHAHRPRRVAALAQALDEARQPIGRDTLVWTLAGTELPGARQPGEEVPPALGDVATGGRPPARR